mmetsp:Transcript_37046/g.78209  ORF Transcript_37046/g.78209 Transcript_37046/m.78209 type:complete len:127 (+) Transcript_37046:200-580(+)
MLKMVRLGIATIALLAATPGASAFCPHYQSVCSRSLAATANEDTDFDAPFTKNPQSGTTTLDHEIVVIDDECYLGKYGQHPDCVDFDPIHMNANAKAKEEMPDFSNLGEEIMSAFKNSPLGKLFGN